MNWREKEKCSEKLKAFAASVDPSTKEVGQCQEHTRIQDNPSDREAIAQELKEEVFQGRSQIKKALRSLLTTMWWSIRILPLDYDVENNLNGNKSAFI